MQLLIAVSLSSVHFKKQMQENLHYLNRGCDRGEWVLKILQIYPKTFFLFPVFHT